MVSKATIDRLSARIDAIVAAREPPNRRVVVINTPFSERDGARERHCAEHPEDRGASLYVILTDFTESDCTGWNSQAILLGGLSS